MATSSVSSSTSSSSNVTSTNLQTSSRARVNGTSLISGLDTDTLIQQLTATTRSKIAQQQQKMQLAQWKRDSYREASTKMSDFSNKYFSYANAPSDNITNRKFFNVATINNTSSLLTVSGDTAAASKMQIGSISQLAKAANFTSTKQVASEAIQSGTIKTEWIQSSVQAKSMSISYGGKSYSLSLPENIVLDTAVTDSDKLTAMKTALNEQIDNIADLKGKIAFDVSSSGTTGTFTLKQTSGTSNDLKITSGTLAAALGFNTNSTGVTSATGSAVETSKLFVSKTLKDALSGSTLTFSLNGISKNVTFNASDATKYAVVGADGDTNSLRSYIQSGLDAAYGSGKVNVTVVDGGLHITTTDTTSVISVTSTDNTNVLGKNGALKIGAGESNRLETAKTLKELAEKVPNNASGTSEITGLAANGDGNYILNINGKQFTFSQDTKLSSVMSQINNDDTANVTIAYSSITNTFNVTSKSGGAASKVDISDVSGGGNLAASLFGTAGTAYTSTIKSSSAITDGTALQSALSGSTIKFSLDGTEKDIYFDSADQAQFTTAADVSTYLQQKLDTAFGSGKVTVSNNSGVLTIANTASSNSALTVMSCDKTGVLGTDGVLKISAGSSAATSDLVDKLNSNTGTYLVSNGQDAKLSVSFDNGSTFTNITRTENNFTLDGVNFTLLGQTKDGDSPIKFSTNTNADDLVKKIKAFVDDYNSMITLIDGKVAEAKEKNPSYEPLSDEQKKQMTETQINDWNTHAKKGVLQNDSTLSSASNDLRDAITSLVDSSTFKALSKIGINTASYDFDPSTNGKLSVDEDALKTAITNNVDAVADLFTDTENGIANKLKTACDKYVGTFGGDGLLISLAGKSTTLVDQSTLGKQISDYTSKIKDLNTKLSDEQDRLWSKFTTMEEQLSRLNAQATYLQNSSSNS